MELKQEKQWDKIDQVSKRDQKPAKIKRNQSYEVGNAVRKSGQTKKHMEAENSRNKIGVKKETFTAEQNCARTFKKNHELNLVIVYGDQTNLTEVFYLDYYLHKHLSLAHKKNWLICNKKFNS